MKVPLRSARARTFPSLQKALKKLLGKLHNQISKAGSSTAATVSHPIRNRYRNRILGSDRTRLSNLRLSLALYLLVVVTWLPPIILAFGKSTLPDEGTGTVIVFFPIGSNASDNYHRIVRAHGAFVGHTFWGHAWIAYSYNPGFVQRLKEQGAWAVVDPILLNPGSLMGCGLLPKSQDATSAAMKARLQDGLL
ncbi:MAG: hypothetical protein WA970_04640 [Gammaproteobacteria bacterium]